MLIATLPVTDYIQIKQHIFAIADRVDGIELRLDYLGHWDLNALHAVRKACTLPVILTLRSQGHGGYYPHSETQRLQDMLQLCRLNPDYLDVEFDVPAQHIQVIRRCYPAIKIILSYHNFTDTPSDLSSWFQSIYQPDCYAYKIATYAQSSLDALRMLHFVLSHKPRYRMIGLCMGEAGQCTRILGPVVGSLFSYAPLDPEQVTAPGQLSIQDMETIYHYRQLNVTTKIYALLGDPVQGSIGHLVHNRAMQTLHQNAVYVKLRITQTELPECMHLCRQLPFWGFSVTMPLKEAILPYLDQIDPEAHAIQAVNTIVRQGQQWLGRNTDGLGAIQALSKHAPLAGQTLVLIGAGGAARAIAYVALQHQAKVIIVNRGLARAQRVATELGCEACGLNDLPGLSGYTVCVNTLPAHAYDDPEMQILWHASSFPRDVVAMDIVYQPTETPFLSLIKSKGWRSLSGYEMFSAQALLQIQHWFQPKPQQLQAVQQNFYPK